MTSAGHKREAIVLLHDQGSITLAELLASSLPNHTAHVATIEDFERTIGQERSPGRLSVLLFDLRRIDRAIAAQDRLRVEGSCVLPVGQEPGYLWLGPMVVPGSSGCLNCLAGWIQNNRREKQHWSSPTSRRAGAILGSAWAQQPLAPSARAAIIHQINLLISTLPMDDVPPPLRSVRSIRLSDLTCRDHPLTPLPDCPSCSTMPDDTPSAAMIRFAPRLKASVDSSRVENPLLSRERVRQAFVDRQTGLIKHVFQDLTSSLMPLAAAEMPIIGSDSIEKGFGRTDTLEGSHLIAMLEVLERFAGHRPRAHRPTMRGSFRDMVRQFGDQCPHPEIFTLHSDDQYHRPTFHMKCFDEHLVVDWSWGFSLRRQEPVLIPTQLCYYWLPDSKERPLNRFVYDSSSGCAMGGSVEEATLYGLYELIERDAYLTSWYARIPPRRIDLLQIREPRAAALIARAQADGFDIHLFDMRLDIEIPVVWAMIVDPAIDAPVKSYCASAAHGSWDQAIFSALVEVTTSMAVYQRSMPAQRARALELLRDPWLVTDMPDHVLLYSLPETWDRLSFLFDGESIDIAAMNAQCPPTRERDLTIELVRQVDKVLRIASDVIVIAQGFPAMEHVGITCVKVLAPGLTPVTFGHQNRRFSLDRLNSAAASRGRRPLTSCAYVNPDPHNFP